MIGNEDGRQECKKKENVEDLKEFVRKENKEQKELVVIGGRSGKARGYRRLSRLC